MKSKNLLLFIVFMAVIFLAVLPYVRFVIQRQSLDADLGMIMLDYSTQGRQKFEERVHRICRKARLEPGTYEVEIWEDDSTTKMTVEIRYRATFKIFFFETTEDVVLRNEVKNLGL